MGCVVTVVDVLIVVRHFDDVEMDGEDIMKKKKKGYRWAVIVKCGWFRSKMNVMALKHLKSNRNT